MNKYSDKTLARSFTNFFRCAQFCRQSTSDTFHWESNCYCPERHIIVFNSLVASVSTFLVRYYYNIDFYLLKTEKDSTLNELIVCC